MDLEIIKEHGLTVFVLLGAGKGIQALYSNMREDMKENRKNCEKMIKDIIESGEKREEKIIEAMKEQTEAIKNLNLVANNTSSQVELIKNMLDNMSKRESV